jgi:hypothetical protein
LVHPGAHDFDQHIADRNDFRKTHFPPFYKYVSE